jgi:hypothetical protein
MHIHMPCAVPAALHQPHLSQKLPAMQLDMQRLFFRHAIQAKYEPAQQQQREQHA